MNSVDGSFVKFDQSDFFYIVHESRICVEFGASFVFNIILMRICNTHIFPPFFICLPTILGRSPTECILLGRVTFLYTLRKFRRRPDSVSNSVKIFIHTYSVVKEIHPYVHILLRYISNHDAARKGTHNN